MSQRMLDLLLGCAISTDDDRQPACRSEHPACSASINHHNIAGSHRDVCTICRLVQAIMQRAEVPLRPYLQRFLTIIIAGDPSDSELKDQRLVVIMQARPAASHCLRHSVDHPRMDIHLL